MAKKKPVTGTAAEGAAPQRGGAFVRLPDGMLGRDPDEDQHVPEDEQDAGGADEPTLQAVPLDQAELVATAPTTPNGQEV